MRANIFIFGSLITATIFGLFGQSIAYFMNEHLVKTAPIYYLTGLTIASYTFYLLLIIYVVFKRQQLKFGTLIYFLLFILGIGIPTSTWSLFVLAMWWS